jgi:erythromycin esterase
MRHTILHTASLLPPKVCLPLALILLIAACDGDGLPTGPASADRVEGVPPGWNAAGTGTGFALGLDRSQARSGTAAAYLASNRPSPSGLTGLMQQVLPEGYRGRRVRLSGWVRHSDLQVPGAGLWMRVDGPGLQLAFDNMSSRPLLGSSNWHQVEVVLDVPPNALGITLGVLLSGPGDLLVDDLWLESVGEEVALTDMQSGPIPVPVDSAAIAALYERAPVTTANMDFEGVVAMPESTVEWLSGQAQRFSTTTPGDDDGDLEPLRSMVGSARVVAVGEGTHGTREFFEMKDRIFRFLVREMDFTHFAIEATSPEADDLNQYVLEGTGDPAQLLSSLYFWTWNTQEVRDLIDWMREWNLSAPPERRVRFFGFDMQSPGAAIDSVVARVGRVNPGNREYVAECLACIGRYGNEGPVLLLPRSAYAALPATTRAACADSLRQVVDHIRSDSAAYTEGGSDSAYQALLHYARLVQQYEAVAGAVGASRLRDAFMAENVLWLLDQAPPGTRMMLWAHNGHVWRSPAAMGDPLASALGANYLSVGQIFGTGRFNAVGVDTPLQPWEVTDLLPTNSLESVFSRTGEPLLLFDARRITRDEPAAAQLANPILMRVIGARFDPDRGGDYFYPALLPADFDLMVYVDVSTPTRLLPFTY